MKAISNIFSWWDIISHIEIFIVYKKRVSSLFWTFHKQFLCFPSLIYVKKNVNIWSLCKILQFYYRFLLPELIFTKVCDKRFCRNTIPTRICNHIHYKMWDEITYSFLNFNGASGLMMQGFTWRSGTSGFPILVPNSQMSCRDMTKRYITVFSSSNRAVCQIDNHLLSWQHSYQNEA